MGLFKRMFQIGKSEAHALVDKLEDPIKLTEQGIRDLKKDLDKSMQALAEVKAMAIQARKELSEQEHRAKNYEHKAVQLLQKAQAGGMNQEEADRLATEALSKREQALSSVKATQENYDNLQKNIQQLNANVDKLKSSISKYEHELKTLKARARVNAATKKLNKSMAKVDSSSTIALLERMKNKVEEDEALAQAYGEIVDENRSLDDEIDDALTDPKESSGTSALDALKAKLSNNGVHQNV